MNLLALIFTAMATLPNVLGIPISDVEGQIIGGDGVTGVLFSNGTFPHICGATIMNPSAVLTAISCLQGMDQSQLSVRVGDTSVKVSQVIQNANYNPVTRENDIAILKVVIPLNFPVHVPAIKLQSKGVEVPAGTAAWTYGWETTSVGSQIVAINLTVVEVQVITNNECSNIYITPITSQMICTITLSPDAWPSLSGGPLFVNGTIIGVMSLGPGIIGPHYPGVYTKVSDNDIYDWIMANIL